MTGTRGKAISLIYEAMRMRTPIKTIPEIPHPRVVSGLSITANHARPRRVVGEACAFFSEANRFHRRKNTQSPRLQAFPASSTGAAKKLSKKFKEALAMAEQYVKTRSLPGQQASPAQTKAKVHLEPLVPE